MGADPVATDAHPQADPRLRRHAASSAGSVRPRATRSRGCSRTRSRASKAAPVTVHGAGRTDAGVHALGQVASVSRHVRPRHRDAGARAQRAAARRRARRCAVEDAAPDFHARFSARVKTYRYLIRNAAFASPFERAFVWHVPQPLDRRRDARGGRSCSSARTTSPRSAASAAMSPGSIRTMRDSDVRLVAPAAAAPMLQLDVEASRPAGLRSHGRRLPSPHGPRDRRHAGRGRPRLARAWLDGGAAAIAGARAQAGATAPPQGLFLVAGGL